MSIIHGELVLQDIKYHFSFEEYMLSIYEFGSEADPLKAMIAAFSQQPRIDMPETVMGTCYPDSAGLFMVRMMSVAISERFPCVSTQ